MMTVENDTQRFSLEGLKQRRAHTPSATRPDTPAYTLDADFWDAARVVMPSPGKTSVRLRLDSDVLEGFRANGKGHRSRMNAVLRSFMEAHKG